MQRLSAAWIASRVMSPIRQMREIVVRPAPAGGTAVGHAFTEVAGVVEQLPTKATTGVVRAKTA